MEMKDKSIILFDGVCNLCNGTVNFLIRRDRGDRFRFATLQSDTGRRLWAIHHDAGLPPDSFVLIENDKTYDKSTAFLRIVQKLPGGWKLLSGALIIPRFLRDAAYSFVARNRYKWFGKKPSCMLPEPGISYKFL